MANFDLPKPDEFVEAAKDAIDAVEGVSFSTGGVYAMEYQVFLKDDSVYVVKFERIK